MTLPHFDEDNIRADLYSYTEIDLLRILALQKLYAGDPEKSLRMLIDIDLILQTGYMFLQDCINIHTRVISSMAKCYRWLGRYEEALQTSEKGLALCRSAQFYSMLPWLLYQNASALHCLGRQDEARAVLLDAVKLAELYQDNGTLAFFQEAYAKW